MRYIGISVLLFYVFSAFAQEANTNNLQALETRLSSIEEAVNSALEMNANLLASLEAQQQAIVAAKSDLTQISTEASARNNENNELNTTLASVQTDLSNRLADLEALQANMATAETTMTDLRTQVAEITQERDIIQSAFARAQDTADKGAIRIKELEEALEQANNDKSQLQGELDTLKSDFSRLEQERNDLQTQVATIPGLAAALDNLRSQNQDLQDHVSRVTQARDRLRAEHEQRLTQFNSLERTLTDAVVRAATLEAQMSNSTSNEQVNNLRTQYADAQSRIRELEGALASSRAEADGLRNSLGQVGTDTNSSANAEDLAGYQAEIESLKAQLATTANSEALAQVISERDQALKQTTDLEAELNALRASIAEAAPPPSEEAVTATAISLPALPDELEAAKNYARDRINDYYERRENVRQLGNRVTLLELNQVDEALINFQEAQSNVARLMNADIYRLQQGDTLSGIATQLYGDINRWQDILEANSYLVEDPNRIFPGFDLVIPR